MCIHSNPKSYTEKKRLNETDLIVSSISTRLYTTYLVGNLKSIVVGGQSDVSLLPSVWSELSVAAQWSEENRDEPDQGVDLGSLDVVKLLDGILDVSLVGL